MGCGFSAGNGAGSKGDKSKMESSGSSRHAPGRLPCPLSSLTHPRCILHSSCFNSLPSSGLQIHPHHSQKMTSPPYLLRGLSHWSIRTPSSSGVWLCHWEDLGLNPCSAAFMVDGGPFTEPLSGSVTSQVKGGCREDELKQGRGLACRGKVSRWASYQHHYCFYHGCRHHRCHSVCHLLILTYQEFLLVQPHFLPASTEKEGSCLLSMAGLSTQAGSICSHLIPNDYL